MAGFAPGLAMEGFCVTGTSAPAVSPGPNGGTEITCAMRTQPSMPMHSITSSASHLLSALRQFTPGQVQAKSLRIVDRMAGRTSWPAIDCQLHCTWRAFAVLSRIMIKPYMTTLRVFAELVLYLQGA